MKEGLKWENLDVLFNKESIKNDIVNYVNFWSNKRGNKVDLIIMNAIELILN